MELSNYAKEYDRIALLELTSEENKKIEQLKELIGDDLNANPDKYHNLIVFWMDEMIWSAGLRKEIIMNIMGECPGEKVRKQLIYDLIVISHTTKEEFNEIFNTFEKDKEILESEIADEEE